MLVVAAFFKAVLHICFPIFNLFISKHDDLLFYS